MSEAAPKTREEAIAFLQERGVHAFARDWALGKTIGVASHPFRHGEIEGWERLAYIVATADRWQLHNLRRPGPPTFETPSLRAACESAIEALREEIRQP